MSIEEDGFLSKEIESWIFKHQSENHSSFSLCSNLNKLSHKLLYQLQIHEENPQEILIACLFVRALSSYQATLLLTERGMIAEGKILLRSLIEIMFRLCALCQHEEIARVYILEDHLNRRKFLRKFHALKDLNTEIDAESMADLLAEIEGKLEEGKILELNTKWFSQKAGLEDVYNTSYSLLSSTVHAHVRDLEDQLILDSNQKIISFNYGPDVKGINQILLSAADFLLMTINHVATLFKIPISDEIKSFHENLGHLVKTTFEKGVDE